MDAKTMEADDALEMTECDHCHDEISQAAYDAGDGLCAGCAATTFICEGCEDRTYTEDAHATHGNLCQGCGDEAIETERTEALDAAKDEARELLEAIIDSEDLAAVKEALAALKKLQK
jgi:hypothetical protein